jgi:hypothetical protein
MLLPSTVRWLMNRFQLGTHDAASEVGGAHTIIPANAGIHEKSRRKPAFLHPAKVSPRDTAAAARRADIVAPHGHQMTS